MVFCDQPCTNSWLGICNELPYRKCLTRGMRRQRFSRCACKHTRISVGLLVMFNILTLGFLFIVVVNTLTADQDDFFHGPRFNPLPAFMVGSSIIGALFLAVVTHLNLFGEVNDWQHSMGGDGSEDGSGKSGRAKQDGEDWRNDRYLTMSHIPPGQVRSQWGTSRLLNQWIISYIYQVLYIWCRGLMD